MSEIKTHFEIAIKMIETGEAEQVIIDELFTDIYFEDKYFHPCLFSNIEISQNIIDLFLFYPLF